MPDEPDLQPTPESEAAALAAEGDTGRSSDSDDDGPVTEANDLSDED
jgi:hypothetical protein